MNSNIYKIDYKRFVLLMLPTFLRKMVWFELLKAAILPLVKLHSRLMTFRTDMLYDLSHNSQVCYLQAVLNDTFDAEQRRIRIEDLERYISQYIYKQTELKPQYLGKKYLRQRVELGDSGYDFRVTLNGVQISTGELARMRAIINYYRLASKRYYIK